MIMTLGNKLLEFFFEFTECIPVAYNINPVLGLRNQNHFDEILDLTIDWEI